MKVGERVGKGLRLATEAEWEYACRAGTSTPFFFGQWLSSEEANYDGNYPHGGGVKGVYRRRTTAVADLPPNAWGLFDMHGNVSEWCQDWYGDYTREAVEDPQGPATVHTRVLRAGSWFNRAWCCRDAYRAGLAPDYRYGGVGFRPAFRLD